MMDCRHFRDLDNDKTLRRRVGFHPRILRSVTDADDHGDIHRNLCGKLDRIMNCQNIVVMICKSGWHRSVSNAELWSRTLARLGREFHKVSTHHLCQHDWGNSCKGTGSEYKAGIFELCHQRIFDECNDWYLVLCHVSPKVASETASFIAQRRSSSPRESVYKNSISHLVRNADKMSLDLKFKPWDTTIFRPEWRTLCKTVFAQYDSSEPWNIEQSSA